jgi:DNA-directed RNA polymerase subunit beta'
VLTADNKPVTQRSFNSVYMMSDSGARGSDKQMIQLSGIRGLMSKPDGSIIETPVKASFREGLDVLEYFISTHGARKGLADTALKTSNSGYLTRRLVDVAQDVVITLHDCDTHEGVTITPVVEGGKIEVPLRDRVLGRVIAEDVMLPDGSLLLARNTLLDEKLVERLDSASIDQVRVRSPITCESQQGICALCYGRDLARGHLVSIGEAVGVIAAQSIGEPGTQLTMRTFHVGGAASNQATVSSIEAKTKGSAHLVNVRGVVNRNGKTVVVSRQSEIIVRDERNRERERYKVRYGAVLSVDDNELIEPGQVLASWDPHNQMIIAEISGSIRFLDFIEGVTVHSKADEMTGLQQIGIIDPKQRTSKDKDLRPRIVLVEDAVEGRPGAERQYPMPAKAVVVTWEGALVSAGDILARVTQETGKTRDIVGGLPRVSDLFEARKPKDPAILAEISGTVSLGKETKSKHKLIITAADGSKHEELIPKWRQITVNDGELVRSGELVVDGEMSPHDILRLLGVPALAHYLVREIQAVYRLQGVRINDKHIESIIRQMLRKVEVTDAGESHFLAGEQVEKQRFKEEKVRLEAAEKRLPVANDILQAISKAALSTESFISAASFQETTRVLTDAAVRGMRDDLRGLKENVIVGRLVPAGTGLMHHLERRNRRLELQNLQRLKEVEQRSVEDVHKEADEKLRQELLQQEMRQHAAGAG